MGRDKKGKGIAAEPSKRKRAKASRAEEEEEIDFDQLAQEMEEGQGQGEALQSRHGFHFRDDAHRERYDALSHRKIELPKFVHIPTLKQLGLLRDVKAMFAKLGLWKLVNNAVPVYDNLAVEFLTSARFEFDESIDEYALSYRLMDNTYSIGTTAFNEFIGAPTTGEISHDSSFIKGHFWHSVTGYAYSSAQEARTSLLFNPCVRYVQAVLSRCVFPKGETTRIVKEIEMRFLHYMITPATDYQPNAGHFILSTLVRSNDTGVYLLGGHFATLLARYHRINLDALAPPHAPLFLDTKTLWNMHVIAPAKKRGVDPHNLHNREWVMLYPFDHTNMIYFPDPPATTIAGLIPRNMRPILGDPNAPQEAGGEEQEEEEDEEEDPSYGDLRDSYSVLAAQFRNLDARQDRLEGRMDSVEHMTSEVYEWHISQGHFERRPPPGRGAPSPDA